MAKKRLLGVQVLRGILAMLVFLQHVIAYSASVVPGPMKWLYLPGFGGVGVMTFFALTGFVMVQKLDEKPVRFLWDRVRRVYPSLWVSLALAGIATFILSGQTGLTWQVFLLVPSGEFPGVQMPYWTLYWEIIFYLLVSVTMLFGAVAFWGALTTWAIIGLLAWRAPWGQHLLFPGWYDVIFNPFAVFFLSGAVAFKVQSWFSRKLVLAWLLLAISFLFAVPMLTAKGYLSFVFPAGSNWFLIYLAIGAFFAIIAAVHWEPRKGRDALWVKMGNWSYGIYLVHITPMILAVRWLQKYQITSSYWISACVLAAAAIGPAILMGVLDVAIQRRLKNGGTTFYFRNRAEA